MQSREGSSPGREEAAPRLGAAGSQVRYLPARRCQRVFFKSFLCFFFRMRLRRFLISEPMSGGTIAACRRTSEPRRKEMSSPYS